MREKRLDFPATARNKEAICDVLSGVLPHKEGDVLEIGAGSGQHAIEFAQHFPHLTFWPTDLEQRHIESVNAWRAIRDLPNLKAAQYLNVLDTDWGLGSTDMAPAKGLTAILCINVIHISPWTVTEKLLQQAKDHLASDGILFFYGPYKRGGQHTADSNARFDASLRAQNPDWGVRDMTTVAALAAENKLLLSRTINMPANNFSLIFSRSNNAVAE